MFIALRRFGRSLYHCFGKLTAFAGILRGLRLECELDESDNGRLQISAHIQDSLEASKKAAQTIMTRLDQVASVGGISLSLAKS
jgi:hypothetical protein